jgi:hypothetical protein
LLARFNHNHHQHNPPPLSQTITEEEETSMANDLNEGTNGFFGNSRLPKPNNTVNSTLVERATKKAGSSWLSRLKLNSKRT